MALHTNSPYHRAEDDNLRGLVSELDIASQGKTVEGARLNLKEAIELFFESASPQEVRERLHDRSVHYARGGGGC